MNQSPFPHQSYFRLGILSYIVAFILAMIFFKERTFFIDIAFHIFSIIKDEGLAIQNQRFGSFMTQWVPLLSLKLGLPLEWIARNYSMAFPLYYGAIFLACFKVFKAHKLGVVMMLFSVLMVTDTFYWVQSEYPQGLAFCILFFAFLHDKLHLDTLSPISLTVLFLMLITLAFFHPLLVVTLTFMCAFFYIDNKTLYNKTLLLTSLITVFSILIFKRLLFKESAYNTQAMSGVANFFTLFPNYFTIPSNKLFLKWMVMDYYFLPITLVAVSAFYFLQKYWLKLLLVLGFFFGYLLLVNVSYYKGADQFYLENLYLPLSLFLIVPFVYDLLPRLAPRKGLALVALVILIRWVHIGFSHDSFTERLDWQRSFMQETNQLENNKLLVNDKQVPMDLMMMTWASPYEFWLLSSVEQPEQVRSIVMHPDPNSLDWTKHEQQHFVTQWGVFPYAEMNKKYFDFRDTTHPYVYYEK